MAGIGGFLNDGLRLVQNASVVLGVASVLAALLFAYKKKIWYVVISIFLAVVFFGFPKQNTQHTNKEDNNTTIQAPRRIE